MIAMLGAAAFAVLVTTAPAQAHNEQFSRQARAVLQAQATSDFSATPKTALVLLVKFNDTAVEPYTVEQARQEVFTQSGSVSDFYRSQSWGRTWLQGVVDPAGGDVYGWITIPYAHDQCDQETYWAGAVRTAAATAGYDLSKYDFEIQAYAPQTCATNSYPKMWCSDFCHREARIMTAFAGNDIQGGFRSSISHELGHLYGLEHAHSYRCTTADGTFVTFSDTCTHVEYGDRWDLMGNELAHINGYYKLRMNWLDQSLVRSVTKSALLYIPNDEGGSAAAGQLVRIPRKIDPATGHPNGYLFLEMLRADPLMHAPWHDFDLNEGIAIRTAKTVDGLSGAYVLDMYPKSTTAWDGELPVGGVFNDTVDNVRIEVQSIVTDGAIVRIDIGAQTLTLHRMVGKRVAMCGRTLKGACTTLMDTKILFAGAAAIALENRHVRVSWFYQNDAGKWVRSFSTIAKVNAETGRYSTSGTPSKPGNWRVSAALLEGAPSERARAPFRYLRVHAA